MGERGSMIHPTMSHAALLAAALTVLTPVVAAQPVASVIAGAEAEASTRREAFVKRSEAAFATRDPKSVAALADLAAWRAAGYPELSTLQMVLPPAPLAFEKELTPLESVWRDGGGRRWRLVLREVKGELRAVVLASPCPRGIVTAPGAGRPERPTPRVEVWTLLECWPLPN
jgi:hypothetical protein